MVTIDCPPQILVVSDNRKGLISNAALGYRSRLERTEEDYIKSKFFKMHLLLKSHILYYTSSNGLAIKHSRIMRMAAIVKLACSERLLKLIYKAKNDIMNDNINRPC